MRIDEIDRIERDLGVTLPAVFRSVMTDTVTKLGEWPDDGTNREKDYFFSDPNRVVEVNQSIRQQPKRFVRFPRELSDEWPTTLLIFGQPTEDSYFLIDTADENPRVQIIANMTVSGAWRNLAALANSYSYAHKTAWKTKTNRKPCGPNKPVDSDSPDLLSEGRALARSAVHLTDHGAKFVAVWRGEGVVPAPTGNWQHCISVDCQYLPDNPRGLSGTLSLYEDVEDLKVTVVHDPRIHLQETISGTQLFANDATCLPPVDAIFLFGSESVEEWLDELDWPSDAGYNGNFPDPDLIHGYQKVFQIEHPFFHDIEYYAMLGGWHIPFDDDWAMLESKSLILTTFRDSEPWYEVWDDGQKLHAIARIT